MTLHESDFSEINHYKVAWNTFFNIFAAVKCGRIWLLATTEKNAKTASFGATPHRGLPSVQVLRFLSVLQRGYSPEKPRILFV